LDHGVELKEAKRVFGGDDRKSSLSFIVYYIMSNNCCVNCL